MKQPIELYTDGSSLRNPGSSGLAYLIRYWEDTTNEGTPEPKIIEGSDSYRLSTNNRMEIMAVICGMNNIIHMMETGTFAGYYQINLFTDSEYVANAINQNWISKWVSNNWMTSGFKGSNSKPVKNKDLWQQIIDIQDKLKSLGISWTISHVKGHSDNEFNNRCDQLAVQASNNTTNQKIDVGYESTTTIGNRPNNNNWR